MNPNELAQESADDLLASCLAEFDEAIKVGADTTALLSTDGLNPFQDRLAGNTECLQHLHRRWKDKIGRDSTSADQLLPARIGRFEIRSKLGQGGNGVVFLAYDPNLQREVALKVPRIDVLSNPELVLRFEQEARAAALLDHPNIAAVFETGRAGPISYITSCYCPGVTLSEWISSLADPVAERVAAALALVLAEAVHHANSRGVLHRDLKPSNIILTPRDEMTESGSARLDLDVIPKITDFGLAKLLAATEDDAQTRTGAVMGTPSYMSPEQAAGRTLDVTIATDVYGLGAILYELLTGRPPFRGETTMQTLRMVESQEPIAPRLQRPTLSRDLETVCLKCLRKEPRDRYPTAISLADDLQHFLVGEPVSARSIGRWERVLRWSRRNRFQAFLVSVILILLVVVSIGASIAAVTFRSQRDVATGLKVAAEDAREELKTANQQSLERLRSSNLAQAQARRYSGQAGQQFEGLRVLKEAAEIRPGVDLRSEAVACLLLADAQIAWQSGSFPPGEGVCGFDEQLTRYLRRDQQGQFSWHSTADGRELFRLPEKGPNSGDIALSSDGLLATFGSNQTIQFTRGDDGTEVVKIQVPTDVSRIAFSADGKQLGVFGPTVKLLRRFEIPSGVELEPIPLADSPDGVAFSPDNSRVAVDYGSQGNIRVYDLVTAKEVLFLESSEDHSPSVVWSPDGRLIAAGTSLKTSIWDAATGTRRMTLGGHLSVVSRCAFHPDGVHFATTSWDNSTRLWNLKTQQQVLQIPGTFFQFDPAGQRLAFLRGASVGIWELAFPMGLRSVRSASEQGYGPWGVAFEPSGNLLVSAGDDGVRIWNAQAGDELAFLDIPQTKNVLIDPQGKWLITPSPQGTFLWPIAKSPDNLTWQLGPRQRLGPAAQFGSISHDGQWLALGTGDSEVSIFNIERPDEAIKCAGHSGVWMVALSPDGRWAMTGTQHGRDIHVWDARRGVRVAIIPARGYSTAQFSPDGKLVATTSQGEPTCLREIESWEPKLTLKESGHVVFSHDSQLLAMTIDRTIKLLDVRDGKEFVTLKAPEELPIGGVAFARDNDRMAVGCFNFHTIQIWNLHQIRQRLAELKLDWEQLPIASGPMSSGAAHMKLNVILQDR